ncbi:MAG: hypothetical protein MPK62_10960, partial [Alphaproteobacteria bacterium]|nr:hypothetical protein [Alphaproteobacteria bacterium]
RCVEETAYDTADGTATLADDDYVEYDSSVWAFTIATGQSTATFTLNPRADTKVEANETFTVTVASLDVTKATVGNGTVTVTILDDDPEVDFTVDDTSIEEGDPFEITVTATHPVNTALAVPLAITAATADTGADLTSHVFTDGQSLTPTVTIPAGESEVDLAIATLDDQLVDGSAGLAVNFGAALAARVHDDRTAADDGLVAAGDATELTLEDNDSAELEITANPEVVTRGSDVLFSAELVVSPNGSEGSVGVNLATAEQMLVFGLENANSESITTFPFADSAGPAAEGTSANTGPADALLTDAELMVAGAAAWASEGEESEGSEFVTLSASADTTSGALATAATFLKGGASEFPVGGNGAPAAQAVIELVDAPVMSVRDVSAAEGEDINVRVSLSNSVSEPVSGTYTLSIGDDDTAQTADFVNPDATERAFTIPANTRNHTFCLLYTS